MTLQRERSEVQDPTELTMGGRGCRGKNKANPGRAKACLLRPRTRGEAGTARGAGTLQQLPAGSNELLKTKRRAFLQSLNFLVPSSPSPIYPKLPTEARGFGAQRLFPQTRSGSTAPASQDPRPRPAKPRRDDRTPPALGLSSHLCPAACSGGAGPRWRGASARSIW